jgi:hypothetical protein
VLVDRRHPECLSVLGNEHAVRSIFVETFLMGEKMGHPVVLFDEYVKLCTEWFLTAGAEDSVVVSINDEVIAYAFVCTDFGPFDEWTRRESRRLAARVIGRAITFRLDRESRLFWWTRTRDAIRIVRARRSTGAECAQVHMNILQSYRDGSVALLLRDTVDAICERKGVRHWVGEVNSFDGVRRNALARLVGEVINERENLTASRLLGRRVVRLTVRRLVRGPA